MLSPSLQEAHCMQGHQPVLVVFVTSPAVCDCEQLSVQPARAQGCRGGSASRLCVS